MLKRLFISLLILSALTAKGGFGQLTEISDKLPSDMILSLCGAVSGPAGLAKDAAGMGTMGSPAFYVRYLPAAGETQKANWAKLQEYGNFSLFSYNRSYNSQYMRIILPYTAFNSARAVSYGSDSSPPV